MKETFVEKNFKPESMSLIATCEGIVEVYQSQGLKLTLRQLYYQLVTKNLIRNEERAYKNLSALISDARLAGLIDWDAIEDRIRKPQTPPQWRSLKDLIERCIDGYRSRRWDDQPEYVELWVEKDALAGVLAPIASDFHVTLMVNRGYSSQSAMYEAAQRIIEETDAKDKEEPALILYLGDLDPSGEDMVRDVEERLQRFEANVTVEKVALTPEQVAQYKPPPNPAKMSDSRAGRYVAQHGTSSWEVDALPPDVLDKLVRRAIKQHVDEDVVEKVLAAEDKQRRGVRRAMKGIK